MRDRDLWIDFNDLNSHGHVVTLTRFVEPRVSLALGSQVVAGDDDGNLCEGRILAVNPDGTVELALDMGTFQASDSWAVAVA